MTDVEILSALEKCSSMPTDNGCNGCPYENKHGEVGSCIDQVRKDAVELIKRQKAEIMKKSGALLSVTYIAKRIPQTICDNTYPDFNKNNKPVNVWNASEGYAAVDALVEQITKEATS